MSSSSSADAAVVVDLEPGPVARELKTTLLERVRRFRELQRRDGDVAIDFGVRGGELNETSRAPQKVDFYAASEDVGRAADDVLSVCDDLGADGTSPVDEPTAFLGDAARGADRAPLRGAWRLLFTTAADASFSDKSGRGAATARNVVDAARGRVRNIIDFATREDGTEPVLKQLNVVIAAKAVSKTRVELRFKYAKAVLTKFFFFPLFGRKLAIYIPVPGPFITRCIVFFSRLFRWLRRDTNSAPPKKVPKAYFDVMYLDKDLRIHRTGEDNIFVQARDTWEEAKPLLDMS